MFDAYLAVKSTYCYEYQGNVRSASLTVLLSPSSANICHLWSRTSRSLVKKSSSAGSFSPIASRIAAADLFGRTAGDMVNKLSKEEAERWLVVCLEDDLMEVMACEAEVSDNAWVMSCLSLAYIHISSLLMYKRLGVKHTSNASIIREATCLPGAPRLC